MQFCQFILKLSYLFLFFGLDNFPNEHLDLGLLEHAGHDQVEHVLVFEQGPILALINLPQMVNFSVDCHHVLHEYACLIHDGVDVVDWRFVERVAEYFIHLLQETPIKVLVEHRWPLKE